MPEHCVGGRVVLVGVPVLDCDAGEDVAVGEGGRELVGEGVDVIDGLS